MENIHNIMCKDPSFEFGSRTTDPPTMREVCGDDDSSGVYMCGPQQWAWERQWNKTIINFIIKREDLNLLQVTNLIAFCSIYLQHF